MAFLRIEKVTEKTKELEGIKKLYIQAFPENERRPFEDMLSDKTKCIEVLAFYDGEQFCGFACLLNTEDISHIIYLAIEDSYRNKGYGSLALTVIHKQKAGRRVIVDIERENEKAENNEQRQKRKQFYLRNGYKETEVKYHWEQEDYEILAYGGDVSNEDFEMFWDKLYPYIGCNY